ncbi:hypothetical protein CPLU01_02330 [Colletotrichum plurivorum]|uniref:Uncharacterized protein n=1 Tax=Colletotrichum plurivorum TaxID=2175906 RepID=A0A8H6KW55_9PEZI|nr:hypothetical protein CPLU01_02330 [Colletotrichum plurivorum]
MKSCRSQKIVGGPLWRSDGPKSDENQRIVGFDPSPTVSKQLNKNNDNAKYTRQLHAYSPWTGFRGTIEDHIGTEYTFVFWHLPGSDLGTAELAPEQYKSAARVDHGLRATIFTVPVKDVHTPDGVWVSVALDGDI